MFYKPNEVWQMLVSRSGNGLCKGKLTGREVYEFEIEAAFHAQRIMAEATGGELMRVMTAPKFSDPVDKPVTFRNITESIHHTIKEPPSMIDGAMLNVWHSVCEMAYAMRTPFEFGLTYETAWCTAPGEVEYLTYCRECRDWEPHPDQFGDLRIKERNAWADIHYVIGREMSYGFLCQGKRKGAC